VILRDQFRNADRTSGYLEKEVISSGQFFMACTPADLDGDGKLHLGAVRAVDLAVESAVSTLRIDVSDQGRALFR
jgi:hypothetical protein